MTFIYKLNPYPKETHWMCENERRASKLAKVIVFWAANVHLVTRGHFRSRDKDDGHAIRSAVV